MQKAGIVSSAASTSLLLLSLVPGPALAEHPDGANEDPWEGSYRGTKALVTVSGTTSDEQGAPVSGIQVMLMGNNNFLTTLSDASGNYSFSGVVTGTSYTVAPDEYAFIYPIDSSAVSGDDIVQVAVAELGNTDGPSPGRYHGHGNAWCSEYVSWVYWQAGEPFVGGIGDGGACTEDWNMSTTHRVAAGFGRNENWQFLSIDQINAGWTGEPNEPLTPQPGDYIFFSNEAGWDRAHSGLVETTVGSDLQTIEGNVSNLVYRLIRPDWRTYQSGSTVVKGIGYRRIVSQVTFTPRFEYFYPSTNHTVNFTRSLIAGPQFADGFETGNTSRWSASMP